MGSLLKWEGYRCWNEPFHRYFNGYKRVHSILMRIYIFIDAYKNVLKIELNQEFTCDFVK